MLKKIIILTFLIAILPLEAFADTITTSVGNAPIQESYDSTRVLKTLPVGEPLTMTGKQGQFYKVTSGNVTGWVNMGYTDQGSLGNLSANSSFLQVAKQRKNYVYINKYTYSQNVSRLYCPLDASKAREVDCSTFVCDVLVNYGRLKGYSGLANMGRFSTRTYKSIGDQLSTGNSSWSQYLALVPSFSQAKPGDILLFNGHVEIYAGNGMVYSCGSTSSIQAEGLVTYKDSRPIVYIFRVK